MGTKYLVESCGPTMESVGCNISRDVVGMAFQGELGFSDTIGHPTNRAANVRTVCEVVW